MKITNRTLKLLHIPGLAKPLAPGDENAQDLPDATQKNDKVMLRLMTMAEAGHVEIGEGEKAAAKPQQEKTDDSGKTARR